MADFEAAAKAGKLGQLRNWVNGKIVLLGTDSRDDRRDTPFFTLFSGDKSEHARGRNPRQHDPHAAGAKVPGAGCAVGGMAGDVSGHRHHGVDRHFELAAGRAVAFVLLEIAVILAFYSSVVRESASFCRLRKFCWRRRSA